jgi:hypothetical protein
MNADAHSGETMTASRHGRRDALDPVLRSERGRPARRGPSVFGAGKRERSVAFGS